MSRETEPGWRPEVAVPALSPTVSLLVNRLDIFAETRAKDDLRIVGFARGFKDAVLYDFDDQARDDLSFILEASFTRDPEIPTDNQDTYAPNKVLRILNKFGLRDDWKATHEHTRFPEDFLDKSSWRELTNWVFSDDERRKEFYFDLAHRDITSCIVQRYVTLQSIANLHNEAEPGRFIEPSALDFFCSQNYGLRQIIHGLPFNEVTIYDTDSRTGKLVPSKVATDVFNAVALQRLKLGPSWGIDRIVPDEEGAEEWAYACNYPSEFLDQEKMQRIKTLQALRGSSPLENFNQWNLTADPNLDDLDFAENSMDIVFESNGLYLMPLSRMARSILNMNRFVRKSTSNGKRPGVFGWLELAKMAEAQSPPAPLAEALTPVFDTNPHAEPFTHTAVEVDMDEFHPVPREVMRFRNGRCLEAVLGEGAIAMLRPQLKAA